MRILRLRAHAKINLYLDVLNLRDDGYHEIQTLMQSIALSDDLQIIPHSSTIEIHCDHPELANSEDNLAFKAAELLKDQTGIDKGVRIELNKRIPLGAGLAGGSADAAAVLTGLNKLWDLDLSLAQLQLLGAQLGSDVPFCLQGGTFWAEGRGEKLKEVNQFPEASIVIAAPNFSLSTAKIYGKWDEIGTRTNIDRSRLMKSMQAGDLGEACSYLANALEEVVFRSYPEVRELKSKSLEAGALGSLMSGSGPCVFSITESPKQAKKIATALSKFCSVFITSTAKKGIEIVGN